MFDFLVRLARGAAMDAAASDGLPRPLRYALRFVFAVLLAAASGLCLFLAWSMRAHGITALLLAALGAVGLTKLIGFVRRILRG